MNNKPLIKILQFAIAIMLYSMAFAFIDRGALIDMTVFILIVVGVFIQNLKIKGGKDGNYKRRS